MWKLAADGSLARCLMQLDFGMRFLDGYIDDPRPQLRKHDAEFIEVSDEHRAARQRYDDALIADINRLRGRGETAGRGKRGSLMERATKLRSFNMTLRLNVMPGLINLMDGLGGLGAVSI